MTAWSRVRVVDKSKSKWTGVELGSGGKGSTMKGQERLKEEPRRLLGQTNPTCQLLPFGPGVGWGV